MENTELEREVLSIISMDNKIILESEITEDYFTTQEHKKLFKLFRAYDNQAVIQSKLNEKELQEYYEIVSKLSNVSQWFECVSQLKELAERRKYYQIAH